MAILTGINTKLKGSAGQWTFSRLKGQTVAKEKADKQSTPSRTMKQMKRRMQWANVVTMWRAFGSKLHPSFENKAQTVTDYGEFVSVNAGIVPVYLSKSEARQGGCVVAPYQITFGTLPAITVGDGTGDVKKTDIALGSTFAITSATTVKDFSDAVVDHNADFRDGDEIAVFIARQLVNAATQTPYVVIEAESVTLNRNDNETLLRDVVSEAGFSVVDECLGASAAVNGGIAWVHSRNTQNGTKVSSQRFIVTNTLLEQYQTAGKLSSAIESYGGLNGEDFLTPKTEDDEEPGPGPVPPADYTLTLALDPEDAGTYSVNGEHLAVGEYEYPAGAELEVHFEAAGGWTFGGWKNREETDPDFTLTLNGDTLLEAIVLED